MARVKDLLPKETVENAKDIMNYRESKAIFNNLWRVLNSRYHKENTKIITKGKLIHKVYVEIPLSVGLKYDLIAINLPVYVGHSSDKSHNDTRDVMVYTIGKDKCECINGKYYAWVKPIKKHGRLYLYYKKKYIPAKCIFGRNINRIN